MLGPYYGSVWPSFTFRQARALKCWRLVQHGQGQLPELWNFWLHISHLNHCIHVPCFIFDRWISISTSSAQLRLAQRSSAFNQYLVCLRLAQRCSAFIKYLICLRLAQRSSAFIKYLVCLRLAQRSSAFIKYLVWIRFKFLFSILNLKVQRTSMS